MVSLRTLASRTTGGIRLAALSVLAAVLWAGGAGTGHADGNAAAEGPWLQRVETAYGEIDTLRADFTQTTKQVAFGRTTEARGTIVYRDGRMRWDYTYPDPQTYIVTPDQVLWAQPSERQLVKMPIGAAFASGAPAALLGGMQGISQYFQLAEAVTRPEGAVRLTLKPDGDDPQVQSVVVDFVPAAGIVQRIETTDAFGNVNTVALDHVRRNTPVSAATFEFTLPAGWRTWTPPAMAPPGGGQ